MAPPPAWCEIRTAALVAKSPGLGPGGAEALALAEEIKAGLILLDGRAARTEALRRGLLVSGLIGVLLDAAEHGLINLQDALDRLVRTSFYIEPGLITEILAWDAERQKLSPKQRGQLPP